MTISSVVDPVLLGRVYDELLAASFPPEELVARDEFLAQPDESVEVIVDIDDQLLLGAAVLTHHADLTMLTYLVVSSQARGQGTGGKLMAQILRCWRDRGTAVLVAEVERPGGPAHPDFGDADRRLKFYDRHGAKAIDLPYFQPPIGPGYPPVPMILILLGALPGAVDSAAQTLVAADALAGLFDDTVGPARATAPEIAALYAALSAVGGVKLWPMSDYAQIAPATP